VLDSVCLPLCILLHLIRLGPSPAKPREPASLRLVLLLLSRALRVRIGALGTALSVVVGTLGTPLRVVECALSLALEVLRRARDLAVRVLSLSTGARVLLLRAVLDVLELVRSRVAGLVVLGRRRVTGLPVLLRGDVGGLGSKLLRVGKLLLSGALGLANVVASVGRLSLRTDTSVRQLLVAGCLTTSEREINREGKDRRTRSLLISCSPTALACCE
jgi:hypothetical protein